MESDMHLIEKVKAQRYQSPNKNRITIYNKK